MCSSASLSWSSHSTTQRWASLSLTNFEPPPLASACLPEATNSTSCCNSVPWILIFCVKIHPSTTPPRPASSLLISSRNQRHGQALTLFPSSYQRRLLSPCRLFPFAAALTLALALQRLAIQPSSFLFLVDTTLPVFDTDSETHTSHTLEELLDFFALVRSSVSSPHIPPSPRSRTRLNMLCPSSFSSLAVLCLQNNSSVHHTSIFE